MMQREPEYDFYFKHTKGTRIELVKEKDYDDEAIKAAGETSGVVRLYKDGDVCVCNDVTDPAIREKARQYGISIWDEVYPDEAEQAKRLSRDLQEAIRQQDAFTQMTNELIAEGQSIETLTTPIEQSGQHCDIDKLPEQIISIILPTVMGNGQIDGVFPGVVVFLNISQGALALKPIPLLMPYWKYRAYRVLEHVAQKTNPDMLIHISDSYIRDPQTLERTGEGLLCAIWEPYGTAKHQMYPYTRDGDGKPVFGEPTPLEDNLGGGKVFLRWREPQAAA
jgi:hypothetical protein